MNFHSSGGCDEQIKPLHVLKQAHPAYDSLCDEKFFSRCLEVGQMCTTGMTVTPVKLTPWITKEVSDMTERLICDFDDLLNR